MQDKKQQLELDMEQQTGTEQKQASIEKRFQCIFGFWLLVLEGLLWRHGLAVTHFRERVTGSSSPGRCPLVKSSWKSPPTIEPVDSRAGSAQIKKLFSSVQFSCSVMSDSLQPHGLQHARPPCPSPTPRVYSNSCPLSQWCHPTISSSVVPFSPHLQSFPASGSFSNDSVLRIRWPKYWSFSFTISSSNEYSGLISFRID